MSEAAEDSETPRAHHWLIFRRLELRYQDPEQELFHRWLAEAERQGVTRDILIARMLQATDIMGLLALYLDALEEKRQTEEPEE